jgi:hypothetical protein
MSDASLGPHWVDETVVGILEHRPHFHRRHKLMIFVAGLASLAVMPLSVTPAVAARDGFPPGVAVEFKVTPAYYSPSQLSHVMDLAVAAGADAVYTVVNWNEVAPKAAGQYDWRPIDSFVAAAVARHLQIRFQLSNSPDWLHPQLIAQGLSPGDRHHTPPVGAAQIAQWTAFVRAVATRYDGKVKNYEIWNEENYSNFWKPKPDAKQYLAVLQAAYTAIKSVRTSDTVIFGGLSRNDTGYLSAYYAAAAAAPSSRYKSTRWFDMLGVHPYSDNRSPTTYSTKWIDQTQYGAQDLNFLGLRSMKSVMDANGDTAKQIWIGEYGLDVTPTPGGVSVTDAQRASWVAASYQAAASLGYVRGLGWYNLMQTPADAAGYALVLANGTETATYNAFVALHTGA